MSLLGYPKVQVLTLWNHLFSSYAKDKQTDRHTKQTDGLERPAHADQQSAWVMTETIIQMLYTMLKMSLKSFESWAFHGHLLPE